MESYFPHMNDNRCINTSPLQQNTEIRRLVPSFAILCIFYSKLCISFRTPSAIQAMCSTMSLFLAGFDKSSMIGCPLSHILLCKKFIDHDDGITFEALRMALVKFTKGLAIRKFFGQDISQSFRCYVDPKLFIQIFEFSIPNPWELVRDAIVNHSLSIQYPLAIVMFCANKRQPMCIMYLRI
eukprot:325692_1